MPNEVQTYPSAANRISALLTLMRLPGCVMLGFAVILGEMVASPTITVAAAFCGFLTGLLLLGANMVLNGFKRDVDASNHPERVLPADLVKPNELLSFAIVLASFGILFAAYLGLDTLLIATLSVVVIAAYHAKLKKHGLVGHAFAGGFVALIFLYSGFANGMPTSLFLVFVVMAFLAITGREIMKSLASDNSAAGSKQEVVGDFAQAGKRCAISCLSVVVVSMVPLILGLVSSYYLPLIVICDVGFLLTSYSMKTTPTPRNAKRNENYVLVWISFGLLAFVIGAL
jgi:4-hydroxybenzoate polyprenyltransferase